jgi:H/ACA ribonucleoprotein complex subunit 2
VTLCLQLVKESAKVKSLRRGVKEVRPCPPCPCTGSMSRDVQVVKALRKGETGVCIIAGNISPIDVISHIPVRTPFLPSP